MSLIKTLTPVKYVVMVDLINLITSTNEVVVFVFTAGPILTKIFSKGVYRPNFQRIKFWWPKVKRCVFFPFGYISRNN